MLAALLTTFVVSVPLQPASSPLAKSSLCEDESDAVVALLAAKVNQPELDSCSDVVAKGLCSAHPMVTKTCARTCGACADTATSKNTDLLLSGMLSGKNTAVKASTGDEKIHVCVDGMKIHSMDTFGNNELYWKMSVCLRRGTYHDGKCRLKHRSGVASASGNAYITGLNACVNTGYTKESDTSNVYIDLEIYDQDTLGGVHDDSAGKLHLSFSDIPKGPWGPDGNYAPGVKKYLDHGSTVWVYQK